MTAMHDSTETAAASVAVFDALAKGAGAPEWVTAGILSAWLPGPGAGVRLITVSENATFLVNVLDTPRLVVRLQRPGYVGDIANVRSELQWIAAVADETEIRTPRPVPGADGELVQRFEGPGGSLWTAVAFEHFAGTVLEDEADRVPHFTEIGRLTGLLHAHARRWRRPDGFRRFEWDLPDMVGPSARWGMWQDAPLSAAGLTAVSRAQDRALATVGELHRTPERWGLIHSDLRPSNVMIDSDGLAVIDFDDSGFGWYLYDFGAALTFYEHRPEGLEMAANWLEGYRRIMPLDADDLRIAGALAVLRRLTILGWTTTHRPDAVPADLWEERVSGTVEVAQRYLDDPLWLADPR